MSPMRLALLLLAGLLALSGGAASPLAPALAAGASAAPAIPAPQQRTVRQGFIPSINNAPAYLARERGHFAAEGIDWQWEPVQVTAEAIAQVGSGNLEVATVTVGAAVLNSIARGVDIKIIAGNHASPPVGEGSDVFLVRKDLYDSGLTDASGLRGRRVAGNSLGVLTEYAINQAMRTAGMSIDDIEFVAIPFPDIPAAFANGIVDAAFLSEPSATRAITQGSAVPILPGFLAGTQITVLMAGPSLLRDRALAEGYLRAYLRGTREVVATGITPEIAAIVEQYARVPAAVVQQVAPPYWDPDLRVNWDSLADQQRYYLARGSATYREPLDLVRLLGDDAPRQSALASLPH